MSYHVPETRCLGCGHRISRVSATDATADRPQPGDPICCIQCGAVATVDESGAMRALTEAEMNKLIADPVYMREIARLVIGIHYLQASIRHGSN